jgi:predicted N-acetyltransferase YhbS
VAGEPENAGAAEVDVSDESSVVRMVETAVESFGGCFACISALCARFCDCCYARRASRASSAVAVCGSSGRPCRGTLRGEVGSEIVYRRLVAADLRRLGEIDRTERIDTLYVQRGAQLEARVGGDWSAPPWFSKGESEHSVAHQIAECERYLAAGGTALGAFADGRLVGIGIVTLHIRTRTAQLAFLHVSNGYRCSGIGGHLSDELGRFARAQGDTTMVVSATPSLNTVRFYRRRGFEPMSEPLPELYELEPDDVHMEKRL